MPAREGRSLSDAGWRIARGFAVTAGTIVVVALAYCAWKRTWGAHDVEDAIITSALIAVALASVSVMGGMQARGFGVQYAQTAGPVSGEDRAARASAELLASLSFSARVAISGALVAVAALVARYA